MSLLIFLQLLEMVLKNKKQSLGDALVEAANTSAAKVVHGPEIKHSGNAIVVSRLKHLLSLALACVLIMRNLWCSHQERSWSCEVKKIA